MKRTIECDSEEKSELIFHRDKLDVQQIDDVKYITALTEQIGKILQTACTLQVFFFCAEDDVWKVEARWFIDGEKKDISTLKGFELDVKSTEEFLKSLANLENDQNNLYARGQKLYLICLVDKDDYYFICYIIASGVGIFVDLQSRQY